jgi:uncharacterized protein YndB with AHSA1/START domain
VSVDEEPLPFIDRHSVRVDAAPEEVWEALSSWMHARRGFIGGGVGRLLVRALRATEPAEQGAGEAPPALAGFEVRRSEPPHRLVMAGRHRFAVYTITFHLSEPEHAQTELALDSHAAFIGRAGRAYRGLVIGTGAHTLVVRRMLRQIRNRADGGS